MWRVVKGSKLIGSVSGVLLVAMATTSCGARQPSVSGEGGSAKSPVTQPRVSASAMTAYRNMTRRQRVGQLFIPAIPATGPSDQDVADLEASHIGNVFLNGTSTSGRASVDAMVTALDPSITQADVAPYVGVDQEGGLVQHLKGDGFSEMPTALDQGQLTTQVLTHDARRWARQLRKAGINLDFAPVADTVPKSIGTSNQPIGQYDREYGYTVRRVRRHVVAFAEGMTRAGISTAVKHFPGLGRASGNTDDTRRVTDPTRRHDPYLRPFDAVVVEGTPFVMVSSAIYPNIDPGVRACFSSTIIQTILRGDEGFSGIVVSDSFDAASVSWIEPRKRAIRFLEAGGTMVLDSQISDMAPMTKAVLAKSRRDPAFARIVKQDVLLVLDAKANAGLIG